jgi:hypothetical protein
VLFVTVYRLSQVKIIRRVSFMKDMIIWYMWSRPTKTKTIEEPYTNSSNSQLGVLGKEEGANIA